MANVGFIKVAFLFCLLLLFFVGLSKFIYSHDSGQCDKVTIVKRLQFSKIKLGSSITEKFPHYTLHYYGSDSKKIKHLSGIPILYIPGHLGNYLEAESLGSALNRITKNLHASFHFDLFVLDFAGDLSGLFGPVLMKQTEFSQECIDQILLLYGEDNPKPADKIVIKNDKPENVFVIGHSMGGMVARALFLLAEFDRSSVQSIVTLATPHRHPPIATLDWNMASFYDRVNDYWSKKLLDELFFHSIGGGVNDIFVRQLSTRLDKPLQTDNTLMTMTTSSPRIWASMEHGSMLTCKSFVYELARAFYDSVDKKINQFSNSSSTRYGAFQYHFEKNAGPVYQKNNYELMTHINQSINWQVKVKRSWKFLRHSVSAPSYAVMIISKRQAPKFGFIAITNVANPSWFGACTLGKTDKKCQQIGNFGRYANLLPPTSSNLKIVLLDGDRLDMFTHWVVHVPQSEEPVLMMVEMYSMKKRLQTNNVTTIYDVITSPIQSLFKSKVIIGSTRPSFLFYNISLHGFNSVLQAFRVEFICNSCLDNTTVLDANFTVVKMHVPWSKEHLYLNIPRGENAEMIVMLNTPAPPAYNDVYLHVYNMARCSYKAKISISWMHTFAQFVRFYASYLPAYILMQILMALSWQLMLLDELCYAPSFTEAHINWAQPYRVGSVAFVVRFVLSYSSEDETFGSKLGLPADDVDILDDMGLWTSSMPLLLYMVAYSFVLFSAWLCNMLLFAVSQFITTLPFRSRDKRMGLIIYLIQCTLLIIGFLCTLCCGVLGIITSLFVFIIRMLTSGVKLSPVKSPLPPQMSKYNLSFTFSLILAFSLVLSWPSLAQWWLHLSWESWNLVGDPTRNNGIISLLATMLFVYSDFPVFNHGLLSVAGMICYLCCICISLYCTVHIFRAIYFIEAILMTVAIPSFLIHISRQLRSS